MRARGSSPGAWWMIVGSFACSLLSLPLSALIVAYPAPAWQFDLVRFLISGVGLGLGVAAFRRAGSRSGYYLAIAALSLGAVVVFFEVWGVMLQLGHFDVASPD